MLAKFVGSVWRVEVEKKIEKYIAHAKTKKTNVYRDIKFPSNHRHYRTCFAFELEYFKQRLIRIEGVNGSVFWRVS